mmetsp:Transcript_6387/g.12749  ORF Transcript_6387/g.12749 Transcript_6387/m.12749 type:complete len:143 (-) Transcript_6387:96-524(-)
MSGACNETIPMYESWNAFTRDESMKKSIPGRKKKQPVSCSRHHGSMTDSGDDPALSSSWTRAQDHVFPVNAFICLVQLGHRSSCKDLSSDETPLILHCRRTRESLGIPKVHWPPKGAHQHSLGQNNLTILSTVVSEDPRPHW